MFGLRDEYDGASEPHRGGEFEAKNVTIETERERIPWKHLIPDRVKIPTLRAGEDRGRNPLGLGDAGLFEGAAGFDRGVYRGCYRCRMNKSADSFCIVCEEIIVEILESKLDAFRPDGAPHEDSTEPIVIEGPVEIEEPNGDVVTTTGKRIVITIGGFSLSFRHDRSGVKSAKKYLDTLVV